MADIDLKPWFRHKPSVETVLSLLTALQAAIRSGKYEPVRHFLAVRLQDREQRGQTLALLREIEKTIQKGNGQLEQNPKSFLKGLLPPGVFQKKVNGKMKLFRVLYPKGFKPFTDKPTGKDVVKEIPSEVKTIHANLALENFGASQVGIISRYHHEYIGDRARRVIDALPLVALEAVENRDIMTGTDPLDQKIDLGPDVQPCTLHDVLEELGVFYQGFRNAGQPVTTSVSFESKAVGLTPVALLAFKLAVQGAIQALEKNKLTKRYAKLYKVLKVTQDLMADLS